MGNESSGRSLPIGAGDCKNGDGGTRARGVQHVEDGPGHVAWLAIDRVGVHPDAWSRVDLDDHRTVLLKRYRDVRGENVEARDVEPNDIGRHLTGGHVIRMNLVGAIDRGAAGREVGGRSKDHPFTTRWDGIQGPGTSAQKLDRHIIYGYSSKNVVVTVAAAGITVGLLDQLVNAVLAVPHDVRRYPLGDRYHSPVYHQHAEVPAPYVVFHQELRVGTGQSAPGATNRV